ncbi:putative ankyrin repeat-containing protein [Rosa chinensis]|uniref:Putative ankyrin repeat-containing protein n=1 Tax=Rosa chinensis TaxID=74649 RepID=A0A2P6QI76_ROSCH|nr:ankyrin repeat-containing protein At5g02620 [Rosa chinensis]PRQ33863.1 putative ankyrin repeat-containing protein [Rosa chinensis]
MEAETPKSEQSPPEQPPAGQRSLPRKKMTKQLTGKRDDTPLHSAARSGNMAVVKDILENTGEEELKELLAKQNSSAETPLYVASEYGYVDLVREMIKYYDLATAGVKARNGFDALHIAAKQGDMDVLKILMDAHPELTMTVDLSNTTALHTAANQGHIEVVNFLLEAGSSLATIARSNGKTALHSAARNGHLEVMKALLEKEPGIATRTDKKGQTALHMAAKGQNLEVVELLINADSALINMCDNKENTALHIATRKGRIEIVKMLLQHSETEVKTINKSAETALDTAEKTGNSDIKALLQEHGVQSAKDLRPQPKNPARELKQTVSDIKHEVHHQLEHTRQTRRRVQGIAKRLHKMHTEGLNNAINSNTVVAVLIATVTFAGIFQIPGQWIDDPKEIPDGMSLGEAKIANQTAFKVFFVFNAIALFISLAVVVVQTSVVVIESKAKRHMMAIINKLMWFACVNLSVAFLALSFVVVGADEKWLAIGVTIIGTVIMIGTLGTMCFWIVRHRMEAKSSRTVRRNSIGSQQSKSWSLSAVMSESELLNNEFKKMYAV